MGNRNDNIIDDERADALLRQALKKNALAAPPDLAARTFERLPAVPPSEAARRLAVRGRNRVAVLMAVLVPLALLALVNIWSVGAHGPQMAFLFGDGRSGMSSMLLSLHLIAKPLWNTFAAHSLFIVGGLLGVAICVVVLRQLVRRIQHQYEVEDL